MASQNNRLGHHQDALRLADSALAAAKTAPPAVTSLLLTGKAQAHAKLGNLTPAFEAQDTATELLSTADPADTPPEIYWFGPAELACNTGARYLDAGRWDEAEAQLRQGLAAYDPSISGSRIFHLTTLATGLATAGHLDQACTVAAESAQLLRDIGAPPRRRADFLKIRRALHPYQPSRAVTTFDHDHADLLTHPA
jgi:tetratricopeptide (TPR) repeat protein